MQYYDKIAHLYDIMYTKETGIDHVAQVQWVDQWREKLGLPKTVLDLACGTGQHLACFAALEYTCSGIDASKAMLAVAARRLQGIPLSHGLFHTFQLPAPVPIITCFFNAMQYNRTLDELRTALRNIHANLRESGMFIFDILCTTTSQTVPQPVFQVKEFAGEGLRFSRTFVGVPTADGFQSTMYYVVFDGVSTEVIRGTTLRGMYSAEEVKRALTDCGFTVLYNGNGYSSVLTVFVTQKQPG
jgi:SAM-dependent methyltransferase